LNWQVKQPTNRQQLANLLQRVDMVPPSLAAAQMAEESGWGTSRFADLGNAFFGQWSWTKGIRPLAQRSGKGDYRIAAFDKPVGSVTAYVRNLNTSTAYADFRRERERLRKSGSKISGAGLVHTLINYSERREDYIRTLKAIMRVNLLAGVDDAYLADGEHVVLVPVGEGAN